MAFAGFLFAVLAAPATRAEPDGYFMSELPASGCNNCHSGGKGAPVVQIIANDGAPVEGGATVPVQVRISAINGPRGGFSLRVAAGTLTKRADQATRVNQARTEATHSRPGTAQGDPLTVVFVIDWTAPSAVGNVLFEVYGLSARDVDESRATFVSQSVEVVCPRDYVDADGDGHGLDGTGVQRCSGAPPPGTAPQGGDCNDSNAAIHPGAFEVCNGVDDNCNGERDELAPDAPALCISAGETCMAGSCQPAPMPDAGTGDAGVVPDGGAVDPSDGGSDAGDAGPGDGGWSEVLGRDEVRATAGCTSAATGVASFPLLLLAWALLRRFAS